MQDHDTGQNARHRSGDVRFIGALMGRYVLTSRRNRVSGVQVFACRLQSISPRMFVASAPVLGDPGEGLTASFQPFGMVRGRVERLIEGGFSVRIDADVEERALLAKRISWHKNRTLNGLSDKRKHARYMPRNPRSVLVLADGAFMECLIIDMSSSGVAVSADVQPAIGTPLAVGQVVGRVVRWLEVGFAVQFATEQKTEMLEELLHATVNLI